MLLSKFKSRIPIAAAAIFAALGLVTVIYYIIYPSAAYFHADCSDTLLWAQASYDGKAVFNPDFGYAAMLPIGGATLMLPFISLFGVSVTTHRIGLILFTLILYAAVLFLCRSAKFGWVSSFFTVGVLSLTVASSEKMREIFYEHVIYYSICVLVFCLIAGLYLRCEKRFEKSSASAIALGAVALAVTVIFSLDGAQVVAMSIMPVAFALVCETIFSKEKIFSKANVLPIFYCLTLGAGAVLGLAILRLISNGVEAGYAGAYMSYSNTNEWINNLHKLPEDWCLLFGFDAHYGMSILSVESVINIIRLGAALLTALVPVVCLFFINRFDKPSRLIILSHFGVTGVIIFGYIFGILSLAAWRLSPIICTGVIVCVVAAREAKNYITLKRVAAIGCAVLTVFSLVSVSVITAMPKNGLDENRYYHVAQFLDENGLNYGYATFWNSQCISVLSDFDVRAANTDVNEHGITPCRYQSNKNWFEPVEGVDRYFLLLSDREIETLRNTEDWHYIQEDPVETLEYDGFTIFVFENTDFLY